MTKVVNIIFLFGDSVLILQSKIKTMKENKTPEQRIADATERIADILDNREYNRDDNRKHDEIIYTLDQIQKTLKILAGLHHTKHLDDKLPK